MTRYSRTWDPLAAVDSRDLFRDYLEAACSDEELVQWVMRHLHADGVLTEAVSLIITEAVGYLCRRELIEQVVRREQERLKYPGYRRWCIRALEADRERRLLEGSVR